MLTYAPFALAFLISGRVTAQSWGAWDESSDTVTETVTNTFLTCPCDGSETTLFPGHHVDGHGQTWSHFWSHTVPTGLTGTDSFSGHPTSTRWANSTSITISTTAATTSANITISTISTTNITIASPSTTTTTTTSPANLTITTTTTTTSPRTTTTTTTTSATSTSTTTTSSTTTMTTTTTSACPVVTCVPSSAPQTCTESDYYTFCKHVVRSCDAVLDQDDYAGDVFLVSDANTCMQALAETTENVYGAIYNADAGTCQFTQYGGYNSGGTFDFFAVVGRPVNCPVSPTTTTSSTTTSSTTTSSTTTTTIPITVISSTSSGTTTTTSTTTTPAMPSSVYACDFSADAYAACGQDPSNTNGFQCVCFPEVGTLGKCAPNIAPCTGISCNSDSDCGDGVCSPSARTACAIEAGFAGACVGPNAARCATS